MFQQLDLDAIADPGDKIRECEFFLNQASAEVDRTRFRWFISAYLNAVYSYFETTAMYASVAFTDPKTGYPIEDTEAIEKLRTYVSASQSKRNPYYVKTSGIHPVIARVFEIRKVATHHFPLAIMTVGPNLPEDFHLGYLKDKSVPLLALCREVLAIVKNAQNEIDK
uniref:Uncharacterized protein n=1 Tax=Curvibacter symbiont subsp. Hydra magnipapillata TaxID=667019 RepID=C9Y7W9_CURXX|nr:hypothetical protein Csp_A02200 [Curvibacter putative symbiont of Hydra magnipapillata]